MNRISKPVIVLLFVIAILAVSLIACSSGGQPAEDAQGGQSANSAETAAEDTDEPEPTPTPTEVPPEPAVAIPGAELITITTPDSGNGPKPLLEWEAVADANTYFLAVKRESGSPYWAWQGTETNVYLGGGSTVPDDDASGPILVEPMTLTVFAMDGDGRVIGVSPIQQIAP